MKLATIGVILGLLISISWIMWGFLPMIGILLAVTILGGIGYILDAKGYSLNKLAIKIFISIERLKILSPLAIGFFSIKLFRIGSSPKMSAGGPSIIIFIQSRSSAEKGCCIFGKNKFKIVHKKIKNTDATFTVN